LNGHRNNNYDYKKTSITLVHVYTKCRVKAFKQHAIFVTEKTHTKTISVTEKNTYKNDICDRKKYIQKRYL